MALIGICNDNYPSSNSSKKTLLGLTQSFNSIPIVIGIVYKNSSAKTAPRLNSENLPNNTIVLDASKIEIADRIEDEEGRVYCPSAYLELEKVQPGEFLHDPYQQKIFIKLYT
ncbi:MAG: hypothetical protein F6J93_34305 [Oscillatoria sp. SIO1A7]|nr:hypothetical protein [Oscillatoria sp. SIO1A7]